MTFGDARAVGSERQAEIVAHEMRQQLTNHGVILDEDDAGGNLFRHGVILPQLRPVCPGKR